LVLDLKLKRESKVFDGLSVWQSRRQYSQVVDLSILLDLLDSREIVEALTALNAQLNLINEFMQGTGS
jgi:hypothetical protein